MITADWTREGPLPAVGAEVARIGDAGAWQTPDPDSNVMETTERLSGCKWQYGTVVKIIDVAAKRLGIDPAEGPEPVAE